MITHTLCTWIVLCSTCLVVFETLSERLAVDAVHSKTLRRLISYGWQLLQSGQEIFSYPAWLVNTPWILFFTTKAICTNTRRSSEFTRYEKVVCSRNRLDMEFWSFKWKISSIFKDNDYEENFWGFGIAAFVLGASNSLLTHMKRVWCS